jgi:nondiscriminating glutamyl-tRNA synthetase
MDKFLWMAGEYIRRDSLVHLADECAPFVIRSGHMTAAEVAEKREWYLSLVAGEKERIRTYSEFADHIAYLFVPDDQLPFDEQAEKNARKHPERIATLRALVEWLRPRIERSVEPEVLRDAARVWMQERGLKMPQLFQPLRCALSGQSRGPDVYSIMGWLGSERTLRRLELAMQRLA